MTSMPAFALADVGNGMLLKRGSIPSWTARTATRFCNRWTPRWAPRRIHAASGVVEREGEDGRTVELDVIIDAGRLEDNPSSRCEGPAPPMTGMMKLRTKFRLPPGKRDAIQKLRLDGNFSSAGTSRTAIGPGNRSV